MTHDGATAGRNTFMYIAGNLHAPTREALSRFELGRMPSQCTEPALSSRDLSGMTGERYVYVGCSHNTRSERLTEGEDGPLFRK